MLFFAVSGYCLYNVKAPFHRWYGKRLYRCYLPVLLMTAVYMLLGFYTLEQQNVLWWYVYPTYYHFVASIIVLYIPFYVVMKWPLLKKNIPVIMGGIAVVYLVVYVFAYDKTYYHIDNVREPLIRFLFMESMLLGAWFRQEDARYRNRFSKWHIIAAAAAFAAYFASKMLFSRVDKISPLQIVNQLLIFVLLYSLMRLFAGIDGKLERLPVLIRRAASFLAEITLEVYVVQYVLIDVFRPVFRFPLNWFVITAAILAAAIVLHYVCKGLDKVGLWLISKAKTAKS